MWVSAATRDSLEPSVRPPRNFLWTLKADLEGSAGRAETLTTGRLSQMTPEPHLKVSGVGSLTAPDLGMIPGWKTGIPTCSLTVLELPPESRVQADLGDHLSFKFGRIIRG